MGGGGTLASATASVAGATDPNDILGPGGVGADGFLSAATDPLSYRIRFENQATATAPAREVVVTQTLDADFNPAAFQFAEVGFAGIVVKVPAGLQSYSTRVDRTADLGVYVDVTLDFDGTSGQITAILRAIDPVTFDLVAEADRGFLFPNDATGRGDGYILYAAKPKANLGHGTRLDAQARIVFDTEAPIDTPPIFNTIDATAPTATVSVGPYLTPGAIPLSWAGADVGSGVATYDVLVSTDGGAFQFFRGGTAATSAVFAGTAGRTYRFRVIATDAVGNEQSAPGTAEVTTRPSALRAEIDAPRTVRVGDEAIFKFKGRGPGHNGQLTFRIDWDGDNIVDEVFSGQSVERVPHVFTTPGEYRVQVVVVDASGGVSEVASEIVRVAARPFAVVTDGVLTVSGTDADNRIEVRRGPSGAVVVEIDGEEFGPFGGVTEIRASALGGDDRITIDDDLRLTAILDGGDGNDVIRGGGGDTVQLGGAGNDRLVGGRGRNILIGGTGADDLRGRDGSDILIGGTTAYDRDREKLRALLAAWTRAESYANRVRALRDPSDPVALTASTVQDDGASDELSGGDGSDWFFGALGGVAVDRTDARPGEARG